MGSAAISVTLARSNVYFALGHESHLKALLPLTQLIHLEREHSPYQPPLRAGFIFPLDAVVALSGGLDEDGASTLIRFVGNNDALRFDPLSDATVSLVVRPGHAILIEHDVWMGFGARFPSFLESMVEMTQGRNALSILNAACCSNHRYSKRLARLLLEVRAALPEREEWIPLSQMEIALLMNTRRETIALEMLELSACGLIETGRARIRIRDSDGLHARCCGCYDKGVALAAHSLQIAKRFLAGLASTLPSEHPTDRP